MADADFVQESQINALVTNVATAVKNNTTSITNHINDTSDAHDASAISVLDTGNKFTATDVEAALAEVKTIADDAVTSTTITTITTISQASYDALGTKDANTLYVIV